jgi:hypothetical protein
MRSTAMSKYTHAIKVTARAPAVVAAALLALALSVLLTAAPAQAEFGISAFDQQVIAGPSGGTFSQAGGHPYSIVTEVSFNGHYDSEISGETPDADVKDVITNLTPGLFGNPAGIGQCTAAQLAAADRGPINFPPPECPTSSQVGTIGLKLDFGGPAEVEVPLYNMVPPVNQPAEFGFRILGEEIYLTGNVRNSGDFGITIVAPNIANALPILGFKVTFWGVPADPSHDIQRCNLGGIGSRQPLVCNAPNNIGYEAEELPHADPEAPKAFLTMPVACTAPGEGFPTNLQVDSWSNPGAWLERTISSHVAPGYPLAPSEWGSQLGITGCEFVPFNPSISVQPTNAQADTPSGLDIEISLPQEGLRNPTGIATDDVKQAVVALPAGESVSPSAADGLGGCSLEQIALHTNAPAACPDSSKLGTVELVTPLLNEPLFGAIYLGKPECEPCSEADDLAGRLIKLYIVVEGHGVILKLPGHVELDPHTGRILTTFDNNPQLPFEHLRLNFKAGPRSPLTNPPTCGTYATNAEFTPWSGNAPVDAAGSFEITSGPEGKPCPSSPQAFAPSFAAGTTNNQAGAFSPFSVTFGRADGEQQLGGVTLHLPPGLLGRLSAVSLCPEPQAAQGSCPASSEIGAVTVGAGAGSNPFYVYGGKVFLTGPYKGDPFGLSIVVPALAGPFDLGTVITRASIAIDPLTTALTVSTDPLPTILDGIPLDLRTVNVSVSNPRFIFNPTNCNPLSLTGTLTGGAGGAEAVANSFQATNCGRLGFAPKFTVTTPGKTSRALGAGLTAKIVYPQGAQANIAKVKVSLPKQLPSQLKTLQKACIDSVFDNNPANCPAASRVGSAEAITPVLPEPLRGAAYFVSHGGQAFPDLILVLKGYGITFNLIGNTFISKTGITSTTFNTVPDVPISSFQLTLPQGPDSALAANGNLCKAKLVMPTKFVAQDGAEINRSTPVTATGCPKHKAAKRAKRGGSHGAKSKRRRRAR